MDAPAVSVDSGPAPPRGHGAAVDAPMLLIYDGRCGFCTVQSRRLVRLARPGAIVALDAHAPGVLEGTGGAVSTEQAMAAVQLLAPRPGGRGGWRVYRGCEAVVRALATRRWVGVLAHVYYLPVVRQLCDGAYRWIAQRRYRISRWWPGAAPAATCEDGACRVEQR